MSWLSAQATGSAGHHAAHLAPEEGATYQVRWVGIHPVNGLPNLGRDRLLDFCNQTMPGQTRFRSLPLTRQQPVLATTPAPPTWWRPPGNARARPLRSSPATSGPTRSQGREWLAHSGEGRRPERLSRTFSECHECHVIGDSDPPSVSAVVRPEARTQGAENGVQIRASLEKVRHALVSRPVIEGTHFHQRLVRVRTEASERSLVALEPIAPPCGIATR